MKLKDFSQLKELKEEMIKDEWKGFDPTAFVQDPEILSEYDQTVIEGRNSSYLDNYDETGYYSEG